MKKIKICSLIAIFAICLSLTGCAIKTGNGTFDGLIDESWGNFTKSVSKYINFDAAKDEAVKAKDTFFEHMPKINFDAIGNYI